MLDEKFGKINCQDKKVWKKESLYFFKSGIWKITPFTNEEAVCSQCVIY